MLSALRILSVFCYVPAIYSSWRHQKISAMNIFGFLWSAVRQAALSLVFREFPAVSHYCCVPCWPASCFMAYPETLLNRLWIWVQHLLTTFYYLLQKEAGLLLILGDRQNDLPAFLLFTGHFEFTWQQFMIGVQSSLIMFPINILIVSIFRHTRPQEPCCCKSKRDTPDMHGRTCFSPTDTQAVNDNVTLEAVMKVCVLLFIGV